MSRVAQNVARLAAVVVVVAATGGLVVGASSIGCGGGGSNEPDGNPGADAPSPGDAPISCSVDVLYDDDTPVAGTGLTLGATAVVANATGALDYSWDVRDPSGASLPLTPDGFHDTVRFPIETMGLYQVNLTVTSGSGDFCPTYDTPLNVLAPGANSTTWRIRIVPDETIAAPPQEIVRSIPSSPSFSLGDIILESGVPLSTTIEDELGDGIAAYVRITSATGQIVETYAVQGTGEVSADIPVGTVDALVVPADPDLPPMQIANWNGSPVTVTTGVPITGTVYGPTGAPLDGARVSISVDGVVSTVATTDSNGVYTLHARAGSATEVTIAPTDASGLPRLTAAFAAGPSTPLDVHYDAAVITRNLAGTVLQRGGTPMVGERVTFVGAIGASGMASMGGVMQSANGDVAITAVAGAGGALPAGTKAPARMLSAILVPTVMEAAVVPVDLTSAAPATINAPPMAPLTARVLGPLGEIVTSARVTAIPVGAFAIGMPGPAIGASAGDGTVSLPLAPGGTYDIVIDDPQRTWARQWLASVGPGAIGDVTVQPAMRVIGTIKRPGGAGGARSSSVQVFCYSCTGIAAQRPVGESATGMTGEFSLVVADPGVSAAALVHEH